MKFKKICAAMISVAILFNTFTIPTFAAENTSANTEFDTKASAPSETKVMVTDLNAAEDSLQSGTDHLESSINPTDYESKYFYALITEESTEEYGFIETESTGIPVNLGKSDYDFYYYHTDTMKVPATGSAVDIPRVHFFYHPYTYKNGTLTQPPVEGDGEETEYDVDLTDSIYNNYTVNTTCTWKDKTTGTVLTDTPSAAGTYLLNIRVSSNDCPMNDYANFGAGKTGFSFDLPAIEVEVLNHVTVNPLEQSKSVYYQGSAFDKDVFDSIKVWTGKKEEIPSSKYQTHGIWVTEADYVKNRDRLTDFDADFSDLSAFSDIDIRRPLHAGSYRYVFYASYVSGTIVCRSDKQAYQLEIKPLPVKTAALTLTAPLTDEGNGVHSIPVLSGKTTDDLFSVSLTYDDKVKADVEAQGGSFRADTGLAGTDTFGSSLTGSNRLYAAASSALFKAPIDLDLALNIPALYEVTLHQDSHGDYSMSSAATKLLVKSETAMERPSISVSAEISKSDLPAPYNETCSYGFHYSGRGQNPFQGVKVSTLDSENRPAALEYITYIDGMPDAEFYQSHTQANGDLYIPAGEYEFDYIVPAQVYSGKTYDHASFSAKAAVLPKAVSLELIDPNAPAEGEYTGKNIEPYKVRIAGLCGKDTQTQAGTLTTQYTIYDEDTLQIRDIGTYTVYISLESTDYIAAPFVKEYRVKGKQILVHITNVPAQVPFGTAIPYKLTYEGYLGDDKVVEEPYVKYNKNLLFKPGATITLELQKGSGKAGEGYEFDYSETATTTVGEGPGFDIKSSLECKLTTTSYQYTGAEIRPVPTVTFQSVANGKTSKIKLTNGLDYILSYENNTEVGTGVIHVNGIGDYALSTDPISFNITPKDLSKATIAGVSDTTPGHDPKVVVYDGNLLLTEGVDYCLKYDGVDPKTATAAGKSKVYAQAISGGHYTGATKKKIAFNIASDLQDLSTMNLSVELKKPAQAAMTYTGKPLKPAVIVKKDGVVFKGCKAVYENNVAVGSPKIRLLGTAKAGTYGSKEISDLYSIVPADFSKVSTSTNVKAAAYIASKPDPYAFLPFNVKFGKQVLTQGVDFTYEGDPSDFSGKKAGDVINVYLKPIPTGPIGRNFAPTGRKSIKVTLVGLKLQNAFLVANTTPDEASDSGKKLVVEYDDKPAFKLTRLSLDGGVTDLVENVDYKILKVVKKNNSGGFSYAVTIQAMPGTRYTGKVTFMTQKLSFIN